MTVICVEITCEVYRILLKPYYLVMGHLPQMKREIAKQNREEFPIEMGYLPGHDKDD